MGVVFFSRALALSASFQACKFVLPRSVRLSTAFSEMANQELKLSLVIAPFWMSFVASNIFTYF